MVSLLESEALNTLDGESTDVSRGKWRKQNTVPSNRMPLLSAAVSCLQNAGFEFADFRI